MRADLAVARRRELLPTRLLRLASDQRLVEHVRAGSERAFETLFERHHRALLSFCAHMLRSPAEAEDVVQQTFLFAYRELVHSAHPITLRPWLYAVARHRCLSALRARRECPVEVVPEPRRTYHVTADVAAREDVRATLADVAQLPDDQRAALVLAELGDLPHDEIAQVLGCPREKVKALVFQARSTLVAGRAARDTSCAEIREQLATLRGAALRRATLRRHLHDCPGCREFRDAVRSQRRRLALALPVIPTAGLERGVLAGLLGSGAGGTAVGALGGGGLAATALVIVAIPIGGVAAVTAARSGDDAARPAPTAIRSARAEPDAVRRTTATSAPVRDRRSSVRRAAGSRIHGAAQRDRARVISRPTAHGDRAVPATAPARADAIAPPSAPAERPAPAPADGPIKPVQRDQPSGPPQPANRSQAPATPPQANRPHAPTTPPQANRKQAPAPPPQAEHRREPAPPPGPSKSPHDAPPAKAPPHPSPPNEHAAPPQPSGPRPAPKESHGDKGPGAGPRP